ncbi:MAG: LytR family transcriptional regulator [Chloroflexi bacterium]|nr:LytR family transcriptional regulator [Chloroflexota bacterium]
MEKYDNQKTVKILVDTEPIEPQRQPDRKSQSVERAPKPSTKKSRRRRGCGCSPMFFIIAILVYFLLPLPSRFLLLGIDRSPAGTMTGRSDTMMAFSVNPLLPTVKLLSIPRDLWVSIPGVGENRINTAHFFAEAQQAGTGPRAALNTVNQNFGFNLRYYARFNLESFPALIDSLGGITINLTQNMSGYPPGSYQLNGTQALAFVRSRSDGDDFFRIRQGQLFISAFVRKMLDPMTWPRLPQFIASVPGALDTNIPIWLWPRLGLALARASITGIDTLVIDRTMVSGFVTSEGAQVLLPDWARIREFLNANW